jgi:predicted nuclease of predicted toxin-antitoxin system
VRFLADMGVAGRVSEWLRHAGHDVRHLRDEGLHRLPDTDVFLKAATEQRIILTFDLDFGEIFALSGQHPPSVILFRLHNTRSDHLVERLSTVLRESSTALEEGAIIVVEESRHRVRRTTLQR